MAYQSPLHILESLEIKPDDLNAEGITRLRKKLLAEFNLSTEITIKIKDKAYTKDDVLKMIDQLKNLDEIGIHKAIYEKKHLLEWLENENLSTFPSDAIRDILKEFPEEEWFHLTIKNRLVSFIKECFRNQKFDTITRLLDLCQYIDFGYEYEIYDELYNLIHQLIDDIEVATNVANPTQDRIVFGFIADTKWTDFLNNLPDGFEGIRDAYLAVAVNYTVAIQRKNRTFTYEISYQLFQTQCSDESLRQIIIGNNDTYEKNYKASDSTGSGNSGCSFSWFIFVALFAIIRACSSSSSSSYKPTRDYKDYNITIPDKFRTDNTAYGITGKTSYILSVRIYQQYLRTLSLNETPDTIQPKMGEDLLVNLNKRFKNVFAEEDTTNLSQLETVKFENKTDYDLILFKAGCKGHRSFYVKSKANIYIEGCPQDKLFFYFGKQWKTLDENVDETFGNRKKYEYGHFLDLPKNSLDYFIDQYTLNFMYKDPAITFENEGDRIKEPKKKNVRLDKLTQ